MAVDRGALDYTIAVRDQFGAAIAKFRSDIDSAKTSWLEFKGVLSDTADIAGNALKGTADALVKIKEAGKGAAKALDSVTKSAKRQAVQLTEEEQIAKSVETRYQRLIRRSKEMRLEIERFGETLKNGQQFLRDEEAALDANAAALRRQRVEIARTRQELARLNTEQGRAQEAAFVNAKATKDLLDSDRKRAVQGLKDQGLRSRGLLDEVKNKTSAEKATLAIARAEKTREVALLRSQQALSRGLITQDQAADAARRADVAFRRSLGVQETTVRANERAGRDLLVTFRRLFGLFVLFQGFRLGTNLFRGAIRDAFEFNTLIEDVTLGVRSLLVAVGQVRGSQGQLLTGQEAFVESQKESVRLVNLLRLGSLKTAATFERVLETFQTALAPGLAAGLKPDQIAQFTQLISQAAAAIGLPQNQLAEEIRSLLQGTIQARTTRIAVALGITNEDIRRAKEAGNLADFLFKKFASFEIAGASAIGNFSVLVAKVRDAVAALLGEGTIGLFNDVKAVLKDIFDSIVIITDKGVLINPEAVAVVTAVSDGLREALGTVTTIVKSFTLKDAVTGAKSFGRLLGDAARLFIEAGFGFFRAVRLIVTVLGNVFSIITAIGDAIGSLLPGNIGKNFVSTLVTILVLGRAVSGTFVTLVGTFQLLAKGMGTINKLLGGATSLSAAFSLSTKQGAANLKTTLAPLAALTALIAIVSAELATGWVANTKIFGTKIGDVAALLANGILALVDQIGLAIRGGWLVAVKAVAVASEGIIDIFDDAAVALQKFKNFVTKSGDDLQQANALLDKEQSTRLDQRNKDRKKKDKEFIDDINKNKEKAAQILAEAARVQKELLSGDDRKDTADVQNLRNRFKNLFAGLLGDAEDTTAETKKTTTQASELRDVFGQIPPTILAANEALKEADAIVKEIRDKGIEARSALKFEQQTQDLRGVGAEIVKTILEGEAEFEKLTKKIELARVTAEERAKALRVEQLAIQQKVVVLSEAEQQAVEKQLGFGERLVEQLRAEAVAANDLKVANANLRNVEKLGDKDSTAQAQKAVNEAKAKLDIAKGARVETEKTSEGQLKALGLDEAVRGRVLAIAAELFKNISEQKGVEAEITDIVETRAEIEDENLDVTRERVRIIAERELKSVRDANRELEIQLRLKKLQLAAEEPGIGGFETEKRRFAVERQDLLDKADLIKLQAKREIEDARKLAIERNTGSLELGILEEEILLRRDQQLALNEADLAFLEKKKKRLADSQSFEGFGVGASEALQAFADTSLNTIQTTFEVISNLIQNTAAELSGTIGDAIFNRNDARSVEERINAVLEALVRDIINQLVRIALAKTLLFAFTSGAAEGGKVGAIGRAGGGKVPRRAKPSLAHLFAPGRDIGGRPPGLSPKDTVPIWADPTEWIIRGKSVKKYGDDAMHELNLGNIDAMAFRALAGVGASHAHRAAQRKAGYATGGEIVGMPTAVQSAVDSRGSMTIINVDSKDALLEAMASRRGTQLVVNQVKSNADRIRR